MLLSIVVSFKNEEENLAELIRRVGASLAGVCEFEMIFVNDASTDRSLEILRSHLHLGNVRIINTSRSFGHGPCLFAGLKHAKGDAIVYLDADLQDPPEMIPTLIAEYRKGFDVVITRRKAREGETALKMWVTKKAYQFLQHAARNIFVENAGDFRLVSRRVIDHLLTMDERDAIFRGLVSWAGFKVSIVEYVRAPRFGGVSHHSFLTGVPTRYFFNALVSFSNYPIYVLIALGFLIFVASSALAVLTLFLSPASEVFNRVLLLATLVNTFLIAFLISALGVVGLYIARTYQQVRGRPDYIIESTEGFPK